MDWMPPRERPGSLLGDDLQSWPMDKEGEMYGMDPWIPASGEGPPPELAWSTATTTAPGQIVMASEGPLLGLVVTDTMDPVDRLPTFTIVSKEAPREWVG